MPPRNSTMQPRADALVWLVTGCSSGFGLEFVLQIIARGDYVIATARDLSKHGVMQLSFDDVPLLQLDVTASQESLNEKIAEAIKIYGRIDVLVNNAGYVALGGWEDLGYDGFVKQFETNVFGLLKVTNAVLPQMRERRSGTLVFMSSLSGWKGDEFCGAYAASKFAVEGMVEALHEEVKPLGIRTLLFEPGKLRTKLLSPGNVLGNVSQIDDYKEESARVLRAFANVDSKQRGDPAKAVRIIMDVVRNQTIHPLTEEEYPVTFSPWGSECDEGDGRVKFRLPLGEDAYWTMKIKCEETLQMLSAWERVIASTDNMSTML